MINWLNLFVDYHNNELKIVKWTEPVRGFVVLKYDKRGIGANNTIVNGNIWGNLTVDNLKRDAEKALTVLE